MTAAAALLCAVLAAALLWRHAVRALVRLRLGPYRVAVNRPDGAKPLTLTDPRRVAVIGGGLAGIAAASVLGARRYAVTLFEAQPYLGGKLGSWPVELEGGRRVQVSHGFHAFFRHYYNLNRYLDGLGVRATFEPISDYRILLPDGGELSFGRGEPTPVLNLLALAKQGVFRLRDVFRAPTRDAVGVFLEYDEEQTVTRLDGLSLADFDRRAQLPPRLKMAFNTFARAFFATEDRLSMAELVKGFHTYYLGHGGGLIYDHPSRDFEAALLAPMRAQLASVGVELRLGTRVEALERAGRGYLLDGARFDAVVLAADVTGTRALLSKARGLDGLDDRLLRLEPGQRYAVLRVWLDRAPRKTLPAFVITDRVALLDAITFCDRAEAESAGDVRAHGGSVLELHCYAVPDSWDDAAVAPALLDELWRFVPELQGARVRHRHFALKRDFPAFHVGGARHRPQTQSGVPGLYCAGDWVKLPFPAMLMEAAFSSGLAAANCILRDDGLRQELIESVPLRGLLAGVPQSPARRRLLERPA